MATNRLEFFYFYPREAQTILPPFSYHMAVSLATVLFVVLALRILGLRTDVPTRGNN
jgi:hypothetical protein